MKRHNLSAIRDDYLQSGLSLRAIAAKHGISFSTLAKVSSREQWCGRRNTLATKLETVALQTAEKEGRRLALTAGDVIERSLAGVSQILTRLESELAKPELDASSIRSLVSAWRDVISVGRQSHSLDAPAPSIGQFNQQFIRLDVMDSSSAATMNQLAKTLDQIRAETVEMK